MAFTEHERDGVVWLTADVIEARHGFSTRPGGVSAGAFASLNLRLNGGDARENVLENYRRLGAALGIDPSAAAFTKQVHGTQVRVVTDADRRAPGDPAAFEADGLVTDVPGLPLFCFSADCVPALLYEPQARVAAAVHCGWRSAVGDILGVALGHMRALGARPERVRAALGPAIGACCFETGADVPEAVARWLGGDTAGLVRPAAAPGKSLVDLRGALSRRLAQLGLAPERVAVSDVCTKCQPALYWSHRGAAGGPRGVQCAVIQI